MPEMPAPMTMTSWWAVMAQLSGDGRPDGRGEQGATTRRLYFADALLWRLDEANSDARRCPDRTAVHGLRTVVREHPGGEVLRRDRNGDPGAPESDGRRPAHLASARRRVPHADRSLRRPGQGDRRRQSKSPGRGRAAGPRALGRQDPRPAPWH